MRCLLYIFLEWGLFAMPLAAQRGGVNYDESKVPAYSLPAPLLCEDGTTVTMADGWKTKRRPELLRLFETNVYGRSPGRPKDMTFKVTSVDCAALSGTATRKEISVFFDGRDDGPKMDILLYLPNAAKKPVPAFLGLNFNGNHAICSDPGITLSKGWFRNDKGKGITDNRATEQTRGCEASRWQVEKVLANGFALATVYYGDLEPDFPEGWKQGVRAALSKDGAETRFAPNDWGAIGAWAWGLSRALDYLETDKDIDARHVAVIGHSRLGKTALWAGAQDERFACVISNCSGCGGAKLSRRWFGESLQSINTKFPHWFCGNFKRYNANESALPVDQHELIALMAPRPVYVAAAQEDRWADPLGQFLAAREAGPAWKLFGLAGLGVSQMPEVNHPVGGSIGFHVRTGKHDVTAYDWEQYLAFAKRHFSSSMKRE